MAPPTPAAPDRVTPPSTPTSPQLARPPAKESPQELCKRGNHRACLFLGKPAGRNGKPDLDLLARACADGVHEKACYEFVIGVDSQDAPNLLRAADIARAGCRYGSRRLCGSARYAIASRLWALNARTQAHVGVATTLADAACRAGESGGCTVLSQIADAYLTGADNSKRAVGPNVSLARALLRGACTQNHQASCFALGAALAKHQPSKPRTALGYWRSLCRKKGHFALRACGEAGALIRSGVGAPRDAKAARALFEKACPLTWKQAGSAEGCLGLGQMLLGGEGGKKDVATATQALTLACKAGVDAACKSLPPVAKGATPTPPPRTP